VIANHYGYGLRNDEKPFAHKIPPGGNWKDLNKEDQAAFMKGALNSGGGQTMYLRRLSWDEPALSIIASPMGKATCQLHPGAKDWEDDGMVANHDTKPLSAKALDYLYRDPCHLKKHRPPTLDEPSATLPAVLYKGVPYGLFYPEGGDNLSNVTPINKRPLLDALPKQPPSGLTSVELFAGGGLMRLGIEWAGIQTIWANDFDKNAVRAHRYNFGEESCTLGDITKIPIEEIPNSDIIVGGPPCQDYSVAGKGEGEAGERGKLVWRYLEIIAAKQPKAFLFENVKGLITKRHRPTFDALLQKFDEIGYNVSWKLINAWDYGVAQKRERVFIVGIRKDLGITYEFPPGEYETTGYRPVLRDVIGDLPEPNDTCGANVKKAEHKADLNEPSPSITTQYRCQTVEITDNSHKVIESMLIKPHQNLSNQRSYVSDWEKPARTVNTNRLDHAEIHPGPKNHTRRDYWTPKSDYTYDQANRVQSMDAPSNTIPAHHNSCQPIHPDYANHDKYTVLQRDSELIPQIPEGASNRQAAKIASDIYWSDYIRESDGKPARTMIGTGKPKIHPKQPRRFTVRECLRIQSVPDFYVFPDDMSLSAMYRVVGNGVPSRVAYHLGKALAEQLLAVTPKIDKEAA
jgi:DNA (cytosine-5)-methyltransferase 1